MTELEPIVRLQPAQVRQAAEALNNAFAEDPIYTEIIPDRQERLDSMRGLWAALVDYSLRYGEVYTTNAVGGAACWLPPGQTEMTFWRMLRAGMKVPRAMIRFSPPSRQRLMQVLGTMDRERSRLMRRPYWYLLVVGVDPAHQARGIGGRLIAPVLRRADEQGLPCYLETETESNVAFYQRRGFVVMGEKDMPGCHFHIWLMLREAGRRA